MYLISRAQPTYRIVTGSDDTIVKVVAAETGQVIYDRAFHNDWVRAVLYTTEFFISASDDGQVTLPSVFPVLNEGYRTVRIYDASTGEALGEAWSTGQTGYIKAIAMSPDSKFLAAGGDDCSIILYDISDMDARKMVKQPMRGHSRVSSSNFLHSAYVLR